MASEYRLGTVQAYQFSVDHWTLWGGHQKSSQMPRAYVSSPKNNVYYNQYAATAEEVLWEGEMTIDTLLEDSICPVGWRLPAAGTDITVNKTWAHMLNSELGYTYSGTSTTTPEVIKASYKLPVSLAKKGRNTDDNNAYYTSNAFRSFNFELSDEPLGFNPNAYVYIDSYGLSVRCMTK